MSGFLVLTQIGTNSEEMERSLLEKLRLPREQVLFDTIYEQGEGNGVISPGEMIIRATGYTGGRVPTARNARFGIMYFASGVYMEYSPEAGGGEPLDPEDISAYLKRKGIIDVRVEDIFFRLSAGDMFFRIAGPYKEVTLNQDYAITISADEMEAYLRLLPPDQGGQLLDKQMLMDRLRRESRISYGIDEAAIDQAILEEDYTKEYLIAKGDVAVEGVSAGIEYLFQKEHTLRPRELEGGRVDFRDIDLFDSVVKGQAVVRKTPATPARNGYTVTGKELKARSGKDVAMPRSVNCVLSEDKLSLLAEIDGRVDFVSGRVVVSNTLDIKGDCDMSVGNIDFAGDVVIRGNVISGMSITAGHDVEVYGIAESANINAGGKVVLRQGIQGTGHAKISAGSDVIAGFIERSSVVAGKNVISDSIIHSSIEANQSVIVTGRRGMIIGGRVLAGKMVAARTIGGLSSTPTLLEVGVPPEARNKLSRLNDEQKKINAESEKVNMILKSLGVLPVAGEPPQRAEMRQKAMSTRDEFLQRLGEIKEEILGLEQLIEGAQRGKIHILEKVHDGVKINIASSNYNVDSEIEYATFKRRDNEVIFSSCEYVAGDEDS